MNYMEQVVDMFGVKIGEEFGISGFPNNIYKFDHQHLLCRNKLYRMDWSIADLNILDLCIVVWIFVLHIYQKGWIYEIYGTNS